MDRTFSYLAFVMNSFPRAFFSALRIASGRLTRPRNSRTMSTEQDFKQVMYDRTWVALPKLIRVGEFYGRVHISKPSLQDYSQKLS